MASPENYNQMLSKLGKITGFTTFIFLVILVFLGLIPKITIDESLIPPIKGFEEFIEWVLSFGVLPLIGAISVALLSSLFEVHNKLSKILQIRYVWERFYIVGPMLRRIGSTEKLDRKSVKSVMEKLFYPQVKVIDQHYVHIFWRYALQFWAIFEHFLVVIITIPVLWWMNSSPPPKALWLYAVALFLLAASHLFFVVGRKSRDQADQVPDQVIRSHMRS